MKIKINELEKYEINLPEEVSGDELSIIVDRLNSILKIINKTGNFIVSTSNNIKLNSYHKTSKEEKVEIVKFIDNLIKSGTTFKNLLIPINDKFNINWKSSGAISAFYYKYKYLLENENADN